MQVRTTVMARNGMVVCSQPLASQVGVQVLARGGNAVDAAVATAAALGVLEPMSIGIGGDAFALVYSAKSNRISALDASGRSPYAATPDVYSQLGIQSMPQKGIHSVTVPGAVHGWGSLLDKFGTIPLGELLQPAIELAEEGFPVIEHTGHEWQKLEGKLRATMEASEQYLIHGKAPAAGSVFRQRNLAKTLGKIAKEGPEAFYQGEIAEKIVRCSEKYGGLFSLRDLSEFSSEWVEPITARYRGYDVYELPPSTQGFVALEMLKILEEYDLPSLGHNTPDYLHLLVEAKKLAFADRDLHLADRDTMRVRIEDLIDHRRIKSLRGMIHPDRASEVVKTVPVEGDTEYVAAADREGNCVSFIQSLFMGFGSGIVAEDTGIVLQNRGHMFSLDTNHPNCIGPHKRCVHTLMPGMVFKDGRPFLVLGLKGGHVQPQVQVQMIANVIDFGMTVQDAINAPRFNHLSGLEVALEPEVSEEASRGLGGKGHRVVAAPEESFGGAHAILWNLESGVLMGGSDPRKGGCAIGF